MRVYLLTAVIASVSLMMLTACGNAAAPVGVSNVASNSRSTAPSQSVTGGTNGGTVTRGPAQGVDAHGHADTAKRITVEEAKVAFDKGDVVFVDTRADVYWQKEHIKGSINIPEDKVELRYKEIPKGKKVIAYCS